MSTRLIRLSSSRVKGLPYAVVSQEPGISKEPAIGQELTVRKAGAPRNYAIEIKICGGWGWSFVIALCVVSGGYVLGGIALGSMTGRGHPRSLASRHPHIERWREGWGLVVDGVRYARVALGLGAGEGTRTGTRRPMVVHGESSSPSPKKGSKVGKIRRKESTRRGV
jgi:hypothetical protein